MLAAVCAAGESGRAISGCCWTFSPFPEGAVCYCRFIGTDLGAHGKSPTIFAWDIPNYRRGLGWPSFLRFIKQIPEIGVYSPSARETQCIRESGGRKRTDDVGSQPGWLGLAN
jgi:hypothetical protein